jgi:hypothetical protein
MVHMQLDILAGQISGSGKMEGDVMLDGRNRREAHFQDLTCYVRQKDVLQHSATVRVCKGMCF